MDFLKELPLGLILGAFVLASALFSFYTYYHRSVLGPFVRALLQSGARDERSAVTPRELSITPDGRLRRALKDTGALSGIVACADYPAKSARTFGKREAFDPEDLHFFIPDHVREKAESIYRGETPVWIPIVITAAALSAAVALYEILSRLS